MRARVAGRVTGLMALPEMASRRAGGWGAPSHHWAAVIVLVCLDALHIIPLGMYVCIWLVCEYVYIRMHALLVRMYVYVGQAEGGMVDLSSGWRRTGQDGHPAMHGIRLKRCASCAFRNSSDLLVSDTGAGAS